MNPDSTPASEGETSGKLAKSSIIVGLTCNVTGTHKLPLWIVRKAQKHRCFDRSGRNFPMVWRYNGEALMTGVMFDGYLQWFDSQRAGREVCLLIDEIFAYKAGILSQVLRTRRSLSSLQATPLFVNL